ncbi:MAG: homoaconitase small subunit [Methanobacteriaceae archaeon]|nr:homoaconitase small subunit [Methanobacteriaceae archaeon]
MEKINGKVWKFRDCIDTDVIIAGRYLRTFDPLELASHVMEAEDPEFANNVNKGDIIVGGWNFGCGSSREQAPVAIQSSGVSVIIAKSFARIFYRNAMNIGLPLIVSDINVKTGDKLSIDMDNGIIINETTKEEDHINPLDPFMKKMLEDGGLIKQYLKNKGE